MASHRNANVALQNLVDPLGTWKGLLGSSGSYGGVPGAAACLLEASGALQLGPNVKQKTHTRRQWMRMPLLVSWCTLRCVTTYVEGGRVGMYRSLLDDSHLT
jgi:hypothetical protein